MDIAQELSGAIEGSEQYPFGIADKNKMAAALRKFADEVESGAVLPQEVRLIARGKLDDWMMETLLLRFHRKRVKPEAILFGTHGEPIAAAKGPV